MDAPPDLIQPAADDAGAADAGLGLNPLIGFGTADLLAGYRHLAEQAVQHPFVTLEHQIELARKLLLALLGRSNLEPARGDRRFTDEAWTSNPLYRTLLQGYLAWRDSLDAWVGKTGFDLVNEQRARIALSQLGEALAPTNSWLGNPAAIRRCFETAGASTLRGLQHMLQDWTQNGGLPSQVDKRAFRVGDNLAATDGAVIFRNPQVELIQYTPKTEHVWSRPLLIVPPQINKFYLFDIAPGRSLVEYLLTSGIQVFVVSWRNPTAEHRDWGLDSYVNSLVQIADVTRAVTQSEDLNMVAACSGGITASALLGHLTAKGDKAINATTLLVTVLDTSIESQLGPLMTREVIEASGASSRLRGVLEGDELGRMFAWMRPNDLIWNYWVNNYLLGNDPPAFDLLYWNADTTRLPARLHSDFLNLLLHNPLPKAGALSVAGTPIDLSKVSCDSFVVGGTTDHITPWQACYASTQILGGQREFVLSTSGHIQSVINPPGNARSKFFVNRQLPVDPEAWLAGAQQHEGSWWDHWRDWLVARSGTFRPASSAIGHTQLPLAKAPGTYVFDT